jgi:4-hydroxyphenylpyruvate dioxygenase
MEIGMCLNLGTLRHLDYESQLRAAARGGFRAVGLLLAAVESYLAGGRSLAEARAMLDSYGLVAPEMAFFPDWIYTREGERRASMGRFARICEISQALGARVIVSTTACAGTPDVGLATENYAELCRIAGDRGLIAGLEFLPWTPIRTVRQAARLVRQVDHPAAGLVVDIFHMVRGGSQIGDIRELPAGKIAIVHLNDLRDTGEDVITLCRNRRLFPGEGGFPLRDFLEAVRATGYTGWYSLEILNEALAEQDGDTLARRSLANLTALLAGD